MFKALSGALHTKTSGAAVGVKMTETLIDLQMSYESLAEAQDGMDIAMMDLDGIGQDLVQLGKLSDMVKKTKLQPSVAKFFALEPGTESLMGVDMSKVTKENADKQTTIAVEAMGESIKKGWAKLKEFFRKVWLAIKNFFINLFDANRRQLMAIKKLQDGVGKKIAEIDAEAFGKVKMKALSKATFTGGVNAAGDLIKEINAAATAGDWASDSFMKIVEPGLVAKFGYKIENGSIVKEKESIFKKESKTLGELGWTPKDVVDSFGHCVAVLGGVKQLQAIQKKLDKELTDSIKACDEAVRMGDAKDKDLADRRATLSARRKAISIVTKMIGIYASTSKMLAAQSISMAGKMKKK